MTTSLAQDARRLKKVFARLDADEDPTGQEAAFRAAGRALKDAGISWTQLLEAHLAKSKPVAPNPGGAFADIFDGIFTNFANQAAAARTPPPAQPPRAGRRPIVQGENIPEHIVGQIKFVDERKIKGAGRMVVVQVEGPTASYGPVAMFNSSEIERWEQDKDAFYNMRVRQPQSSRLMPIIFGLRAA